MHLGRAVSGLERRGKDSIVLERIAEQRAQDAQRRLEKIAEFGKLERERVEVERSVLVLDRDSRSALATPEERWRTTFRFSGGAQRRPLQPVATCHCFTGCIKWATAPVGSATAHTRPTSGTSCGATKTLPPRAGARLAQSSTSSTAM